MATIPEEQLPPLPAGFRPQIDGSPTGCGRPVGLGCGCLGIVLIGFLLLVQWQQGRLLDWSVGYWQETLLAQTEDLTSSEVERIEAAFRRFRGALAAGNADWSTVVEINRTWTDILAVERGGGSVPFEDLVPLLEMMEALPEAEQKPPEGESERRPTGEVLA